MPVFGCSPQYRQAIGRKLIIAEATQEAQEEVGRIIAEAENEVEKVAEKIAWEAVFR